MKPRALILTGYGINCDYETQTAFEMAGGEAERVHINDLIDGHKSLDDYQILAFPGGFSFGDDIGAGRVLANKFVTNLREPMARFLERDTLVIGICNGFQVMVKCGLVTDAEQPLGAQALTLTYNDSGRFEDRWVHLKVQNPDCVWLRGIDTLYFPVAHGEGKFYADSQTLDRLESNRQIALTYVDEAGQPVNGAYPANPNGSPRDIAGLCDRSGRVFGLMPHPERFLSMLNHPQWTALADKLRREGKSLPEEGQGLQLFRNAVRYFG